MDKKQLLDSQFSDSLVSGSKGFTLIEVLISTLILGIVIGIALMAGAGFMDVWQKSGILFSDVFVSARHRILLRESVESVYDYYVTDKTNHIWADEGKHHYFPFFKGNADSVEFVTLSSVFHYGAPAIAMLFTEKNDIGKYNLVYKEADLNKFFIKYAQDKIDYSRQIIIYKNLEKAGFRYYGLVETRVNTKLMTADDIFKWADGFSGSRTGHIPEQIEITIDSDDTGAKIIQFKVRAENNQKNGLFNPPF